MNMHINARVSNILGFNNSNLRIRQQTDNSTFVNNENHSFDDLPMIHSNSIIWVQRYVHEYGFSGANHKFTNSALVDTFKFKYGENNISISIENDGNDSNVNYPRFNNPSKFVGCAQNMTQLEELYKSNWEKSTTSSCIDYGYKK